MAAREALRQVLRSGGIVEHAARGGHLPPGAVCRALAAVRPGHTLAAVADLIVAGVLAILVGHGWGLVFPVIKKLWTSSYVLVAGGYSLVLLGLFHQVVDVWGWRRWCQPFVWVGANALTIYLAAQILNFRRLAERLAGAPVRSLFGEAGDTVIALIAVFLLFGFARFLYQRKLFLRV